MSDRFYFDYELHEAGWATARIRDSDFTVDMTVSYLHDSLRELANAAFTISRTPGTSRVVFMDEPGEHQLTLTREYGQECHYSICWFEDWDSWGMKSLPGSRNVCSGTVSVRRLVHQVYSCLWTLYEQYGVAGYKERWGEHDFPHQEMQRLVGLKWAPY